MSSLVYGEYRVVFFFFLRIIVKLCWISIKSEFSAVRNLNYHCNYIVILLFTFSCSKAVLF